jgi:DNA-binding transcriptional ArsR family regulator
VEVVVDVQTADTALAADTVLDAVGEPNRRLLLQLLKQQQEATVSDLVEASGLRQPQVSKHLKVLTGACLVAARVDGRFRRYRLDGRGLQAAHDWFASFEEVWQARFDALDELVSTESTPEQTDPRSSKQTKDQT